MPEFCVTPGTPETAADSPITPPNDEGRRLGGTAESATASMRDQVYENAKREKLINDARALFNGKNYIGQQATQTERQQAAGMAREVHRTLNQDAQAARRRHEEEARRMRDLASGTTVASGSWWVNLKNKVYGLFVSDRGEVNKWLAHFAHMTRYASQYMNDFIRLFERMPAQSRAFATKFKQRRENIIDDCVPLANKAGMLAEDLFVLAGHWQACRHAPERNTFLLRRWQEEIATEQAKKQPDIKRIEDLQFRIQQLKKWRSSDLSNYDENKDGKLYHAGYTDGQATKLQEQMLKETGLTAAELDSLGDRITAEYNYILQERIRMGMVSPDTKIPAEFKHYVPMLSRQSEGFNNFSGASNDTTPYNPGSYYAIQGRNSAPDSPAVTLGFYGQRAAAEIGSRDFGFALNALQLHLKAQGVESGLRSINYDTLMSNIHRSFGGPVHDAFAAIYNRGGLVATVPRVEKLKDGTSRTVWEKKFFYFNSPEGATFEHNGTRFDSDMLNKALSASFKLAEPGPIIGTMARATSAMGQMTTRFAPLFAPISGTRDFSERAYNMANRTYITEDGQELAGHSIIASYFANSAAAGRALYRGMRGTLDPNSREGQWWKEFNDYGLVQKFTQQTQVADKGIAEILASRDRTSRMAKALHMDTPTLNRLRNSFGTRQQTFLNVVDNWNDYFQNVAAFDHYITLRKKGVRAQDAADDVLEMMNMSQRGSIAPWLQALAPFVVPTVQSGTAFLRSMGFGADNPKNILKTGWKGYAALVAAYGAYSMLMPLAKESMGYDENGKSRYDSLSLSEATRTLPMGIGGDEYLRVPIGFGFPQIGALLAVGGERVKEGRMDISDLAFEVMFATMKNVAPGNWPEYRFSEHPTEYMMTMLTPQPFRPIAEVAMNLNYFGNQIHTESPSSTTSPADSGRTSTPRRFHEFARRVQDITGAGVYPEDIEHIERGYGLGIIRGLIAYANQADDIYKGSSRPSSLDSMHPLLAAMGLTSWVGKAPRPEQSLYYEGKRHYDAMVRELGVDIAAPRGVDAEQYKRQVLSDAGMTPEEVEDFITIWKAQTILQQQGRDFNAEYKDRWRSMEDSYELRDAFNTLDEENQRVYAEAVGALNYYNR